jgi:hypothetical protein
MKGQMALMGNILRGGKKIVSPLPPLEILTTSKKLWYHPKLNIK